jgi:RNA polymerase sigma-70 factor (ECF subfamily)
MLNDDSIHDFIEGNEKAFRMIFDKYYQGLLHFAFSYVGDSFVAENIVQDSFVWLWEKHKELEKDSNLNALLVRTVKLKAWNHLEKQRRRIIIEKNIYDETVRELNLKLYTLDSINTTSLYIDEIKEIIQNIISNLPEQTKTIFNLSRNEYLSNTEIAKKMNLSEKSVEYHISKVLKQLRVALYSYLKMLVFLNY